MSGGGILLVILVGIAGMILSGVEPTPGFGEAVVVFTFLLCVLAIFIGLLGLYPLLRPQSPWLATAGAVTTGVAVSAIVIVFLGHNLGPVVASILGLEPPAEIWHVERFVFHLFYLGFPLAFLLFGMASWRSGLVSPIVGLLMIATAALLFTNFVYEFSIWVFGRYRANEWMMMTYGLVPITALIVGYLLWTGTTPADADADLEGTTG